MRQPLFFMGIVRFRREASFAAEAVYRYSESKANGGRKNPLKPKKFAEFQPYTASFMLFRLKAFSPFSYFFGLVKYDRPFFVDFKIII